MAGDGDPRRSGPAVALDRLGDDLPVGFAQVRPVEGEEHPVLAEARHLGRRYLLRVSGRRRQGQQGDTDQERFHPEPPDVNYWCALCC